MLIRQMLGKTDRVSSPYLLDPDIQIARPRPVGSECHDATVPGDRRLKRQAAVGRKAGEPRVVNRGTNRTAVVRYPPSRCRH